MLDFVQFELSEVIFVGNWKQDVYYCGLQRVITALRVVLNVVFCPTLVTEREEFLFDLWDLCQCLRLHSPPSPQKMLSNNLRSVIYSFNTMRSIQLFISIPRQICICNEMQFY